MTEQPVGSQWNSVNFLPSASNVVITGGSFIGVQQNYGTKEIPGQNDSLQPLYIRVSSNAILNAGGRADDVRCHPGTREEVIGIIERWIDGDGDLSRCIFWLSGPAGAGKSAIIQTVAERCIQRKARMANYFFFRADSSRNNASSVVATLLYQILQFYPALRAKVVTLLDTQPLIFDQSIRDQFNYLIDIPVRAVVDNFAHTDRLVLLIDGLDECSSETKRVQTNLLHVLHHLTSDPASPFVVLVASRAEPHLIMTFNEIGTSNDSIFLDEDYQPSHDIRLFVVAEFDKIKRAHHLKQTLDHDWPSEASIDEIVEKSSGQFIYAATVMRFISGSPASPAYSLDKVRGIRPVVKNSPFAELDAIYTHILSQAEDWDSAKAIMASQIFLPKVTGLRGTPSYRQGYNICTLVAPLGLTQPDIRSSLSELLAVVQFDKKTETVIFYHASLSDFLCDESRSKALYINLKSFTVELATAHISAMSSLDDVTLSGYIFALVEFATPHLREALMSWRPYKPDTVPNGDQEKLMMWTIGYKFLFVVCKLYYENDAPLYRTIFRKWLIWFSDLELPVREFLNYRIGFPEASKIWDDIQKSHIGAKALPEEPFWKRLRFFEFIPPHHTDEELIFRTLNIFQPSTE